MDNNKKYYIIYETRNLKNGKIYIGMHETNNLEDGYLGSGKMLKRAIRYYGKEFFEKRILYIFDSKDKMINKEIELITEEFINRKDTYNLKVGGNGGFVNNIHKSKFKLSSKLGRINANKKLAEKLKNDKEYCKRFSKSVSIGIHNYYKNGGQNPFKGKTHSEETKAKMRNSHKGKQTGSKNSQYGSKWITNGIECKKLLKGDSMPDGWKLGRKIN